MRKAIYLRSPHMPLATFFPPEIFFRVAVRMLSVSRGLFRTGVIPAAALSAALKLSDALARAGMASWRERRRRLVAPN